MDAAATYSTRDAARILQVPEPRVRTWARMGGIVSKPGAERLEFTFQELLLLRTTRGLLEAGVPPRRVKRIWSSLKQHASDQLPLTHIRILAQGDRAIAWDGTSSWQADSGQMMLDLDGGATGEPIPNEPLATEPGRDAELELQKVELAPIRQEAELAPIRPEAELAPRQQQVDETPVATDSSSRRKATILPFPTATARSVAKSVASEDIDEDESEAEHWFRVGSELEASSPLEAREAYLKSLDADPNNADAHTNLGRLEHRAGDLAAAEARYRRAIQCAPDDSTAHFNLGVLLEDRRCPQAAVDSYLEAIRHDPDFADAHYNLGLLLEALGRRADALKHLMAAHRLYAR